MKYLALIAVFVGTPLSASEVEIVTARAEPGPAGFTIHVTLRHDDTGWDHYADGWTVYAPNGAELGHRTLAHPHVAEQPFTRSLRGVAVPDGVDQVTIRARDNIEGYNSKPYTLSITRE